MVTVHSNKNRQLPPRTLTGVRLPPDLLERLDDFCRTQPLKPSRTRVIELAIRSFLDGDKHQRG